MSNLDEIVNEELKMLVRSTRNERFRFIIAQFNHYSLIKSIVDELKKAYPQREIHHINIADTTPDTFVSSIFDCKEGFVLVKNFEKLFEETYRPLALGLNQRRDKFANYPIILIALLPFGNIYLQECQKVMPDMFSLANPIIQLQKEIERNHLQTNPQSIQLEYVNFKDSIEAQDEIDRIESRLKTLEQTPEDFSLIINLSSRLGQAYQFLGKYDKAKHIFTDCLKQLENQEDNYKIEIAEIENNLATVLQNLGDYEGAKKLLEKALIADEENFGKEHPTTAISYSNLAIVLKDLGDYEGAKKLSEKALIATEKNFGKEHPTTAIYYSNLGTVLHDLGDYEGAKKLLEKALVSDTKNFGEDHPKTAIRYSNLALVLKDLGDYEGAKKLSEKALISDEKNFGGEHPTTAISYSNLAGVLRDSGDYEGARKLLEKALISTEKSFGEEHPTTALRKLNLASIFVDLKRLNEAHALLNQAHTTLVLSLGEEHPYTKNCLGWLNYVKRLITNK